MTTYSKAGIVFVIVVLFSAVVLIQQHLALQSLEYAPEADIGPTLPGVPAPLPRLVNLKTEACIHCRRMIPIFAELKQEYADKFTLHTFDIERTPQAGRAFGLVRTLPTLVFMDQAGQIIFRFEGYMSKAEILDRWKRLGLSL